MKKVKLKVFTIVAVREDTDRLCDENCQHISKATGHAYCELFNTFLITETEEGVRPNIHRCANCLEAEVPND